MIKGIFGTSASDEGFADKSGLLSHVAHYSAPYCSYVADPSRPDFANAVWRSCG